MKFRSDEELPETGGSKNYIKLKDKGSVEGIFRGDTHEFFVKWENRKSREVPEGTPDSKFRFRVNFLVKEGAVWVPKIFEQGQIVYKQLRELHEEYDLEKTFIKITRNGDGTDTTYSLLPKLKQTMTKETEAHLKEIELLPLESKISHSSNSGDDDLPF